MLSPYDYLVLGFYFFFMMLIGWVTRNFIANTSDYFRGSGQMLWWMTGASAFMTQFSAWSFTGAAGKAYTDGPIILTIFFANALGFFISFLYFAPKMRQLRVITPIQAVRQRFGPVSEQFFTWTFMPTNIFYAGIWLNALGIFLAAVFDFPLTETIIATGVLVVFMSTVGGSWAVVSSDFIQVLILMMVAIVTAIYALVRVGGPAELIERFPAESALGNDVNYPVLIFAWMALIFVKQFCSTNNLMEATRYLTAKDSINARKAGLMASVLFIFGPVLWFIPPMVARIYEPDLSARFPSLGHNATDAAYVAAAMNHLPVGMTGLLIAGILAATMSSMDSGLNRNAGIFVKNFYLPVLRPNAQEKEQMLVSRLSSVIVGALIILAALFFASLKDLGLFDIMVQFGSLVALPITIPLILMMLVRKTPDWSGWATVILGLSLSYLAKYHFNGVWLGETFDLSLSQREINDYDAAIGIFLSTTILPAFFLFTRIFYRDPEGERKTESDTYWTNIAKPVLASEHKVSLDSRQGKVLGTLAGSYGLFILILFLIPNDWAGRLAYVICGTLLMGLGLVIHRAYVKAAK